MTSSDALSDMPTAEDVQRALDEDEGKSMTEVLGVLTGQVPVKSMPIATGSDGLTDEEREQHLKAFNEGIGKRDDASES